MSEPQDEGSRPLTPEERQAYYRDMIEVFKMIAQIAEKMAEIEATNLLKDVILNTLQEENPALYERALERFNDLDRAA